MYAQCTCSLGSTKKEILLILENPLALHNNFKKLFLFIYFFVPPVHTSD